MLLFFFYLCEGSAVFSGAHACHFGKRSNKIRNVGETARERNIFYGQGVFGEKLLGLFTSRVVNILDHRVSCNAMKGSRKIAFAHSCKLCERIKRERVVAFRVDVCNHRFD